MYSDAGEVFEALAVIVTAPIGCLKAHDIAFKPPLPAWKLEAIDRMGNGNLNKANASSPSGCLLHVLLLRC